MVICICPSSHVSLVAAPIREDMIPWGPLPCAEPPLGSMFSNLWAPAPLQMDSPATALSIAKKRLEDWAGISVPKILPKTWNVDTRHYAHIWLDSAPQHFLKQFSVFKVHKLLGSGLNILQFLGKLPVPLWQMLCKLQFLPATLEMSRRWWHPRKCWLANRTSQFPVAHPIHPND